MKPPTPAPTIAARGAFVVYALLIGTLTHWPRLAIASPGGVRLDLFIHMGVFGMWMALLAACAFFGPALSTANIGRSAVIALAYALVDELTQGIPILGRTVDGLDLVSNGLGIVLAATALWLFAARRRANGR